MEFSLGVVKVEICRRVCHPKRPDFDTFPEFHFGRPKSGTSALRIAPDLVSGNLGRDDVVAHLVSSYVEHIENVQPRHGPQ